MPSRNKAERLHLGAVLAPFLRSQTADKAKRRVFVVDEAGEVVRTITLEELQTGLLERAKIELDVDPLFAGPQRTCCGWGDLEGRCLAIPPRKAFHADRVASRSGAPWMCLRCSNRKKTGSTKVLTTECHCGAGKSKKAAQCAVCAGVEKKPRRTCSGEDCGKPLAASAAGNLCRSCFCKSPAFYAAGVRARRGIEPRDRTRCIDCSRGATKLSKRSGLCPDCGNARHAAAAAASRARTPGCVQPAHTGLPTA